MFEGFKNRIFLLIKENFQSDSQRPYSPAIPDWSIDESYGLTNKELQLFRIFFSYKNPEELVEALIRVDIEEKYNELLNYLNIKQTILRDQIKTETSVSRTRLENLVNVVKNILDKGELYDNMPELESKISAEQRRNQRGQGLKILTPDQMLNKLTISLLNAGNNSEKLENKIKQLLYSFYRSKKLTKNIYKGLIDII